MHLYFGGSFNPIHNAHLACARAVALARRFDRVILVPSGTPPHKPEATDIAPAHHRLEMCRRACFADALFDVCDVEAHRTGPSYTIDTVRELKRRGEPEVHWLIGADMLLYLPKWKDIDQLLEEVTFIIMARPGWTMDWTLLPEGYRRLQTQVTPAPLMDISATKVRERIRNGESVEHWVPPMVLAYIQTIGLYRDKCR